jgi:predicted dehydrogenase
MVPFAAVRGSAANSEVRVGLLGSGGRGSRLSSHLVKVPGARLVALCDLFEEQIAKAKQNIPIENPKIYLDYNEMLVSDEIDAVIIATPVFLHAEHLEAAVRAGKHVYVEKPAGVDVAACKRVMKASDSAKPGLNVTFGFQQRYGWTYKQARKVIDSGGLGKIRQAEAHFLKGPITGNEPLRKRPETFLDKVREWKWWRDLYGDIVVETYCHSIDVLNWSLGDQHPIKAVAGGGRTINKVGDMGDHISVVFEYPNDIRATLVGSHIMPPFYREVHERVWGSASMVETARGYWKHYRDRDDVLHQDAPRPIDLDSMEAFVQRIVEGKTENVGIRGAESTLTAILGRMAMDTGRTVTWDEMMNSG